MARQSYRQPFAGGTREVISFDSTIQFGARRIRRGGRFNESRGDSQAYTNDGSLWIARDVLHVLSALYSYTRRLLARLAAALCSTLSHSAKPLVITFWHICFPSASDRSLTQARK
jgi:hypothetical protein